MEIPHWLEQENHGSVGFWFMGNQYEIPYGDFEYIQFSEGYIHKILSWYQYQGRKTPEIGFPVKPSNVDFLRRSNKIALATEVCTEPPPLLEAGYHNFVVPNDFS